MEALAACLFLLLWLGAWAPAPGSASSEAPSLINEEVKRTVDLSSHLAKVTAEVVLAHLGSGSTSRATSFLLALEPDLEARLAHLGVQVSAGDPSTPLSELFPPVPRLGPLPSTLQEMPRPGRRVGRPGSVGLARGLGGVGVARGPSASAASACLPCRLGHVSTGLPPSGRCSQGQRVGSAAD
ncbi:hypothetical protein P7K49_030624 [Saguinus oedipus]|uniref:Dolichyl-diphosphooligosaccharide--protein glycosyltransferase subunit 1 n=1 Tax=Saguinus oedipus TaxID=9490 RepID=A0ABQ9U2N7_SAGOE|nr:hypothetical protein P7K49_030624 [Saguinus oedipus]